MQFIDASHDIFASENDIIQCQFHQWYDIFKKKTIKSNIIPLTDDFINYLLEDGIKLSPCVKWGNNSNSDSDSGSDFGSYDSNTDVPNSSLEVTENHVDCESESDESAKAKIAGSDFVLIKSH